MATATGSIASLPLPATCRVGCGFITWSLAQAARTARPGARPGRRPPSCCRSDRRLRFAVQIKQAGVPLICQVQSMAHAREAVDAGADVIVAQGGEAGGHGGTRSTLTLVPEVADFLAAVAPDTLLVAAGGIADGRGLAAALMLGADGVLDRLAAGRKLRGGGAAGLPRCDRRWRTATRRSRRRWSTSSAATNGRASSVAAHCGTVSSRSWHGREHVLAEPATNAVERERYWRTFQSGDADNTGVFIGEAAGLIRDVRPAGDILADDGCRSRGAPPRGAGDVTSAARMRRNRNCFRASATGRLCGFSAAERRSSATIM